MILQFPSAQERRRASGQQRPTLATLKRPFAPAHAALDACRAEFRAITRCAAALVRLGLEKEKPRQGGTWGPGLEPRMGRAEVRTVAAKDPEYTVNSLSL
jgi:hypothetical protein